MKTSKNLSLSLSLSSLLDQLRGLVTTSENLKQQEQEFRTHCRVSGTRGQTHTTHTKAVSQIRVYLLGSHSLRLMRSLHRTE